MTVKQGSNLFHLRHKALQFSNVDSFTLVQNPFFEFPATLYPSIPQLSFSNHLLLSKNVEALIP